MSSYHYSQDENRDLAQEMLSPFYMRQSIICEQEKPTQENRLKSPEPRHQPRFTAIGFRNSQLTTPIPRIHDNRPEIVSHFEDLHVSEQNAFYNGMENHTRFEDDSCKNSERQLNTFQNRALESHDKNKPNLICATDYKTMEFKKLSAKDTTIMINQVSPSAIFKQSKRMSIPYRKINVLKFPNRPFAYNSQINPTDEVICQGKPMKPTNNDKETKFKRIEKKMKNEKVRAPVLKAQRYPCSCKKSNCKKEYCLCFKNKVDCTNRCSCCECLNHGKKDTEVRFDRSEMLSTPTAITQLGNFNKTSNAQVGSNLSTRMELRTFSKGCNCKKSNCQKKYCDCFSNNKKCTIHCNCDCCYNK